ncbi:MAG: ABC transporter permease [Acidobacteria bacterium]|nr:ABC transporter permease [Acidobacteriota bacterium]
MNSAIYQLARRDFWYLMRQPVTLLWAFVMPVLFFSFLGKVTGRAGPDPAQREKIGVLIGTDAGFLADALERHLNKAGYDVQRVSKEAELLRFERRLTVPSGLTAAVLAGSPRKLSFERSGEAGLGGDYDKIRLSRATYGLLAEIIAAKRAGKKVTEEELQRIAEMPRSLSIDVKPAGKRRTVPSGYQQSVPGVLVMFVLMVMLTSGGISIVVERRLGILRRLASSPMPRTSIVASKWLSRAGLAAVQTTVGATVGTLLYSIEWGEAPLAAAALLAAYSAFCCSLGLLLGSLARTEGQASAVGVLAGNLLSALGGCWWPVELSPLWMQKLSLFLPTGLAMDGLHRLMSFGEPAGAVLLHVGALLALAVGTGWLASRSFRFQ